MPQHPADAVEQLCAGVQLARPLPRHITAAVESKLAGTGAGVGMPAVPEAMDETEDESLANLTMRPQLTRRFIRRMLTGTIGTGKAGSQPDPRRRHGCACRLTPPGRITIDGIRAREHARLASLRMRISPEDAAASTERTAQ